MGDQQAKTQHQAALTAPHGRDRVTSNVVSAIIAGAIAAVGGSLITTARLEERLQGMQDEQQRLYRQVEEIRKDIYRPRWDSQQMVRTPLIVGNPR